MGSLFDALLCGTTSTTGTNFHQEQSMYSVNTRMRWVGRDMGGVGWAGGGKSGWGRSWRSGQEWR